MKAFRGKQSVSPLSIVGWQAVLVLLVSLVMLLIFGQVSAVSSLVGGLIALVTNAFFAYRLFSDKGGWQVSQLAAVTYRGVIGKIFLTIALFLLAVLLLRPLNVAALFAAYFVIQMSPVLIVGLLEKSD